MSGKRFQVLPKILTINS